MDNKLLSGIPKDSFKIYLIIALLILGAFLLANPESKGYNTNGKFAIDFFYSPTCPHCAEQKKFNKELEQKYPSIAFINHDVTNPEERKAFSELANKSGIPLSQLGVPFTSFGGKYFIGFKSSGLTGKEIEDALKQCLKGNCQKTGAIAPQKTTQTILLPLFGEINLADYSLPALAAILGLADGFNPCAMWALVFLISLVIGINDKRKIWLIVGSFVFASGVLYFLFMSTWLNLFLLIGYFRPITIVVGLVAAYAGVTGLRDFIRTKGAMVCEVTDTRSRQKLTDRMKKIVASPLTLATIIGIIALAFVVNAIEFVCSSAIPVVFTQTLALHQLPKLQYYLYILFYDLFFMLDDLIIFGLAAFTVVHAGDKYAKWCKLISAAILLLLGVMLLFAPNLLR